MKSVMVVHDMAPTVLPTGNDEDVFFVFSSHSFWTSMDVPAGVTQEEGNTGFPSTFFLRCLP